MTEWTVPATIVRVVDGDTLDVVLDLGWKISYRAKVRLARCNAPEVSTLAGREAKQFVERVLCDENGDFRQIMVVSHSLDKYGRVLGSVAYSNGVSTCDLAGVLILAGHAGPA